MGETMFQRPTDLYRQKDPEQRLFAIPKPEASAISLEMERGRNQVLIQNRPDIMPEICENQYVIRSD